MKNAPYGLLIIAAQCIALGYFLRIAFEPRCDADAIRTEYDALLATSFEALRHLAVRDSLKAIEIDSLNALLDRPVRPLVQVLDDHRRAAKDASLDTVAWGLLRGVE